MVTSSYHRRIRHGGLPVVPKLQSLRVQFRGDWSKQILLEMGSSTTSESDSNTFAGWDICPTSFSVSLQTWIASLGIHECLRRNIKLKLPECVSIIILLLAVCQFPFLSSWLIWRKVTYGKCGSSFELIYKYYGQFNFKSSFQLCYSVPLKELYFFSYAKIYRCVFKFHGSVIYIYSQDASAHNRWTWNTSTVLYKTRSLLRLNLPFEISHPDNQTAMYRPLATFPPTTFNFPPV